MSEYTKKTRTLKILGLFLCFALILAAVPVIFYASTPKASAAGVTVTTYENLKTAMANGGDITLGADIELDYTASGSSPQQTYTWLTVPAGKSVNLNMNGHKFYINLGDEARTDWWQIANHKESGDAETDWTFTLIQNNGTLNITGNGTIKYYLKTGSMKMDQDGWVLTACIIGVGNTGNLSIARGITIDLWWDYWFGDSGNGNYCDHIFDMYGVYNTGYADLSCDISTHLESRSVYTGYVFGSHNSYNYTKCLCVYSPGNGVVHSDVSASNPCTWSAVSRVDFKDTNNEPDNSHLSNTTSGLYTEGAGTYINGVNISTDCEYGDSNEDDSGGSVSECSINTCGILYYGNPPTIGTDVDVTTREWSAHWDNDNTSPTVDSAAVSQSTSAMTTIQNGGTSASYSTVTMNPASTAEYYDEYGNTYTVSKETTSMNGGCCGTVTGSRVVVYYRFYTNSQYKTNVYCTRFPDEGITANGETYGYTQYVQPLVLSGVSSGMWLNGTALQYSSGAAPTNSYYWTLGRISYKDANVTPTDVAKATGTNFYLVNPTTGVVTMNNTLDRGTLTDFLTTYIYVDYYQTPNTTARMAVGNNGTIVDNATSTENVEISVNYTGLNIVPGDDFIVKIFDRGDSNDNQFDDIEITSRYDCNCSNSGIRQITYKWGTSYGEYPNDISSLYNAGTYYIQATIPDDITYSQTCGGPNNASGSMNEKGDTFEFKLIINKVKPVITGPATQSFIYGTRLSEIDTTVYTASAPAGVAANPSSGVFTFENSSTIIAPVDGPTEVKLTWTPTGSTAVNYSSQTYTVTVTATKRSINVVTKAKTITYGDESPYTNDDVTIGGQGLVYASDAAYKQSVISEIVENLLVVVDGSTIPFTQGLSVGTYNMTGSGDTDNYYVSYDGVGQLQIVKRQLTITAAAYDREYNGTSIVTVSFPGQDITNYYKGDAVGTSDGFAISNVSGTVAAPTGGAPGDVGENLRVYFSAPTITGDKAGNYEITTANITNFENLRVNITKATPVVADPVLETITYDSKKTLFSHYGTNIATNGEGEVEGVWQFTTEARTTVPQVANYGYDAMFVPTSSNYATVTRKIAVTVLKRDITVSVSCPEIYYGDDVPVFTFKFEGFTDTDPTSATAEYINVIGQTINAEGFTLSGDLPSIESYGGYENTAGARSPAGSYPITWSQGLVAANYNFITQSSCTLVVNKKVVTIQAKNANVEYGNNAPTFAYTVSGLVDGDTIADNIIGESGAINCTTTYVAGNPVTSAGYAIDIIPIGNNDSYQFNYVSGKLTVTKATLTLTPDDKTVVYGSAVPTFTYTLSGWKLTDESNASSFVSGAPTITSEYTPTSTVDMTYSITANVGSMTSACYNIVAAQGTVTVTKATPVISEWPSATVENGGKLSDATLSGGSANVKGSFAFAADATPRFGTSDQYDIVFTPTNTNYENVSGKISITVTPKAATGNPVIEGSLMVGETISFNVNSMTPAVNSNYSSIQWVINNTVVSTAETYTLQESDKGFQIELRVTADETKGYTGTKAAYSDDVVGPAKSKPVIEKLSYSIPTDTVYDGQEHPIDVTKIEQNYGVISVYYNGGTTVPKNAGTYVITCNISATSYFGAVSGMVLGTYTIAKAPLYLSFNVNDKVYDGKTTATVDTASKSVTGAITGDDVSINTQSAVYAFDGANAGYHDVTITNVFLTGNSKANYRIEVSDVGAEITQKTVYVEGTTYARVYDPDKDYVDVTFGTISGILTADKAKVTITDGKAYLVNNGASNNSAISYIDFNVTGSAAENYEIIVSNEDDLYGIITKAVPDCEVPTPDSVVYSGTQTLAQIPLTSGWSWVSPTTIPQVATSSYKAIYTPADTANYQTKTADINLVVTKATATITVNNVNLTYGDAKPAFSVTTTGFSGDDSLATCGGLLKYNTNYTQYNDIGSYYVSADQSTLFNANYNFEYVNGTILVGQKELTTTPTAVSRGYISPSADETGAYQVTVNFADLSGKATSADNVELTAYTVTGTINDPNAGTRSVTYALPTLTGTKAGNYYLTILNPNIAVEILKVQPGDYVFPTSATVSYGQTLAYAVFTGGSGDGEFAFADPTIVANKIGTFNGVYEVTFTPTDYVNYESITRYVKLVVTENQLNLTVNIGGSMYSGSTLSATVAGLTQTALNGYTHYHWYKIDDNDAAVAIGSDESQYVITDSDVGYKIRVDVVVDSPFSGSATCTTPRSVEEEQLNFWEKFTRWWQKILSAITGLFDHLHK